MDARARELTGGSRPAVGYQRWDRLLFADWPVRPELLRPLVDRRLELDLHEGRAWVSLTPFTVRGARLRGLPALPGLSEFHEVNLRTYVRHPGGPPGVWFLSLDAEAVLASAAARLALGLPYFVARIGRAERGDAHVYRSRRLGWRRPARLDASWGVGYATGPAAPGSLEHFLVERYALYSTLAGRLLRLRVRHAPWPLHEVWVDRFEETLSRAAGVPGPSGAPLARFSPGVDVELLAPELAG